MVYVFSLPWFVQYPMLILTLCLDSYVSCIKPTMLYHKNNHTMRVDTLPMEKYGRVEHIFKKT